MRNEKAETKRQQVPQVCLPGGSGRIPRQPLVALMTSKGWSTEEGTPRTNHGTRKYCADAANVAITIATVSTAVRVCLLEFDKARAMDAKPTSVIHQSSVCVGKNLRANKRSFWFISHATTVVGCQQSSSTGVTRLFPCYLQS